MYVNVTTILVTGEAQPLLKGIVSPGVAARFQSIIPMNRGSSDMDLGDANVTTGNGLLLSATGSLGAIQPLSANSDLQDFYVVGTAGDTLVTMVFP